MDGPTRRQALDQAIRTRGETYAAMARLLGRNPTYIQQYIRRGTPERLDERDLRLLARHLGVPLAALGGPDAESIVAAAAAAATHDFALVPPLEADGPALGLAFQAALLDSLAPGAAARLRCHVVAGDAMAPTLMPGDQLLIDPGDDAARLRDGLYLLRAGAALVVKRLAVDPTRRKVTILSDNPAYPGWPEREADALSLAGRIVWAGRRFG